MNTLVESLAGIETLQNHMNASLIYGEPVKLNNKVVIPVAKIASGFGGGGIEGGNTENSKNSHSEQGVKGVGRGGGGGIIAYPVGVFEITEGDTRFISASGKLFWGISLAMAFLLGSVISTRKAKA
jgi:uncharacterized spore protein YtfJ